MEFGIVDYLFGGFIVVMVFLFGWLIVTLVQDAYKPTFELKKDEWVCTSTVKETHYVMVGKVLVPMTSDVCVIYQRNH